MLNARRPRPMDIGDLLDAAFRLYRERFWSLIAIATLAYVPMAIVRMLLWPWVFSLRISSFDMFGFYLASFGLELILTLTIGNLLYGALVNAISHAYLGRPISVLGAYRYGLGRYLMLVVASLVPLFVKSFTQPVGMLFRIVGYGVPRLFITGLAPGQQSGYEYVPLVFFCVGALLAYQLAVLLLYAHLLLVPQAVILEGQRPRASLSRSWQLVRGSAGRALGVVVASEILSFFFAGLQSLVVFALPFGAIGSSFSWLSTLFGLIALAGQVLVQPLLFSIFTLFYYDLRVRKEGFDLELIVQQATSP